MTRIFPGLRHRVARRAPGQAQIKPARTRVIRVIRVQKRFNQFAPTKRGCERDAMPVNYEVKIEPKEINKLIISLGSTSPHKREMRLTNPMLN